MSIEHVFLSDQGFKTNYPDNNAAADEQSTAVATRLVKYIEGAKHSLHLAIYDFRLGDALGKPVVDALIKKAAAGVQVRIAYDHTKQSGTTKTDKVVEGGDPAPRGTHEFVQQAFADTKVLVRPIAGSTLMHNKYLVRDGATSDAAVWMGSANWTDDAWKYQENNLLVIPSADLAAYYERDFSELWTTGNVKGTGIDDVGTVDVEGHQVDVAFAPGEGRSIDHDLAAYLAGAKKRIRIASMVISSGTVLGALGDAYERDINIEGVVDETQMVGVEGDWKRAIDKNGSPGSEIKLKAWLTVKPRLHGKTSESYKTDGLHNFMHNKILVVDHTVVTGSFNFSQNATRNAENIVAVHDTKLADSYVKFIDGIIADYPTMK